MEGIFAVAQERLTLSLCMHYITAVSKKSLHVCLLLTAKLRENLSDRDCTKPRKLWEFVTSALNFKIISIHCNASCCHLASWYSAAVWNVWMAFTLYCACPLASFHSHRCMKPRLWSGTTSISQFNRCHRTLHKRWAHAGEHLQTFQTEHFQSQCQV